MNIQDDATSVLQDAEDALASSQARVDAAMAAHDRAKGGVGDVAATAAELNAAIVARDGDRLAVRAAESAYHSAAISFEQSVGAMTRARSGQ